jgi:hypothetical protein
VKRTLIYTYSLICAQRCLKRSVRNEQKVVILEGMGVGRGKRTLTVYLRLFSTACVPLTCAIFIILFLKE